MPQAAKRGAPARLGRRLVQQHQHVLDVEQILSPAIEVGGALRQGVGRDATRKPAAPRRALSAASARTGTRASARPGPAAPPRTGGWPSGAAACVRPSASMPRRRYTSPTCPAFVRNVRLVDEAPERDQRVDRAGLAVVLQQSGRASPRPHLHDPGAGACPGRSGGAPATRTAGCGASPGRVQWPTERTRRDRANISRPARKE